MNRIPISPNGCQKLREELDHIRKVLIPQNIQDIETARAHGDLSENAEYHAAQETNGLLRARVAELEERLGSCQVVDPESTPKDRVVFGAHVVLQDLVTGEEKQYQVLGPYDADPNSGSISFNSPLGRAVLGKRGGDRVEFRSPKGMQRMEVLDVF